MTTPEAKTPPKPTLHDALKAAAPSEVDALMRGALAGLLRWQLTAAPTAGTGHSAAAMADELADFATWCVARGHGVTWHDAQRATWDRVSAALVAQAQAQPLGPVHGGWTVDRLTLVDGAWVAVSAPADAAEGARSGPVGLDLVALLRDPAFEWDEPQEIDWAVRWWDAARHGGLPVDADFGEFWRAHDWLGLQRQLAQLGALHRAHHETGQPLDAQRAARLLASAGRTALRYGPLKPLLRLLEPLSGAAVSAGFTF